MVTKKGTIIGISGHPMSGLWMLTIQTENGVDLVHIESGYGVRNLAACFGAHEGTGDLQEKIQGQEIYYSVDFMGVLEGFTPVDEASPEMVEAVENAEDGEYYEEDQDQDDIKDFLGIGF